MVTPSTQLEDISAPAVSRFTTSIINPFSHSSLISKTTNTSHSIRPTFLQRSTYKTHAHIQHNGCRCILRKSLRSNLDHGSN